MVLDQRALPVGNVATTGPVSTVVTGPFVVQMR